jgi:hypothetical protein
VGLGSERELGGGLMFSQTRELRVALLLQTCKMCLQ